MSVSTCARVYVNNMTNHMICKICHSLETTRNTVPEEKSDTIILHSFVICWDDSRICLLLEILACALLDFVCGNDINGRIRTGTTQTKHVLRIRFRVHVFLYPHLNTKTANVLIGRCFACASIRPKTNDFKFVGECSSTVTDAGFLPKETAFVLIWSKFQIGYQPRLASKSDIRSVSLKHYIRPYMKQI